VWRQLPLEVLRVARKQVADLSASVHSLSHPMASNDDDAYMYGYDMYDYEIYQQQRQLQFEDDEDLRAAKEVQEAAERCIRAIQQATQLP